MASGPKIKGDDLKTIILKGKVIDAEKALRKGTRIHGVPPLVPATWELVRRRPDHVESVVARNVASFDIAPNGSAIYSNGCGIFSLHQSNTPVLLLKDNLIEEIKIA